MHNRPAKSECRCGQRRDKFQSGHQEGLRKRPASINFQPSALHGAAAFRQRRAALTAGSRVFRHRCGNDCAPVYRSLNGKREHNSGSAFSAAGTSQPPQNGIAYLAAHIIKPQNPAGNFSRILRCKKPVPFRCPFRGLRFIRPARFLLIHFVPAAPLPEPPYRSRLP